MTEWVMQGMGRWQAKSVSDPEPYWLRWLYGITGPDVSAPEPDSEEQQQREQYVCAHKDDDGGGAIHGPAQ